MNTLREIGEFIGVPQGSLEVAGFGGPRTTSLKMASILGTKSESSSMQAIIQALQNLTPITLEAQIIGSRSGEEPFQPVIRLNACGGIPLRTFILFNAASGSNDLGGAGGDFTPTQLGPGTFQFVVKRSGISNTGFISLSKTLDPITVTPHPKLPPKEPTISATTEGAGANTVLVVTGSGFLPILPNRIVTVRVVDDALNPERNFQQSSTPSGELKMRINLPCNSGLPFHVSATDSRPGPGILGVVFSNTVTLRCP